MIRQRSNLLTVEEQPLGDLLAAESKCSGHYTGRVSRTATFPFGIHTGLLTLLSDSSDAAEHSEQKNIPQPRLFVGRSLRTAPLAFTIPRMVETGNFLTSA
jgi:hypothetical protein